MKALRPVTNKRRTRTGLEEEDLPSFLAIDFETADYGRDSACAVGAVLVRKGRIAERFSSLIRPPRQYIQFTSYHGLTWPMLRNQPGFSEVWPMVAQLVAEAEFLAAHNASFDQRILHGCCESFGCERPDHEFSCTYRLTKQLWPGAASYKLPDICRRLGVPQFKHHDAAADAEACANLMLAILEKEPRIREKSKKPGKKSVCRKSTTARL